MDGWELKAVRVARGLTIEQAARRANQNQAQLAAWESEEMPVLGDATVELLDKAYGIAAWADEFAAIAERAFAEVVGL